MTNYEVKTVSGHRFFIEAKAYGVVDSELRFWIEAEGGPRCVFRAAPGQWEYVRELTPYVQAK